MDGRFKGRNGIDINVNLNDKDWDRFKKTTASFIETMENIELGFDETSYMKIRELWTNLHTQLQGLTSSNFENIDAKIAEVYTPIEDYLRENKNIFDRMTVKFKDLEKATVGFEKIFSDENKYRTPEYVELKPVYDSGYIQDDPYPVSPSKQPDTEKDFPGGISQYEMHI